MLFRNSFLAFSLVTTLSVASFASTSAESPEIAELPDDIGQEQETLDGAADLDQDLESMNEMERASCVTFKKTIEGKVPFTCPGTLEIKTAVPDMKIICYARFKDLGSYSVGSCKKPWHGNYTKVITYNCC